MFMTGCVVLVLMSSCHDKDSDRLWCIKISLHRHLKQCSICIKNVI